MDVKTTASKMGLEEAEFLEIVQLFVQVSHEDLDKLLSAIENRDARQVFEISHSIKGAAVNLGFQDIADIAREMELNARQDILDGADAKYITLKGQIDSLSSFVEI